MIYRFIHFLGFSLWTGAGWSIMALTIRSRREPPAVRLALLRMIPAIHVVIGTGVVLTLFGGIMRAVDLAQAGATAVLATPGKMTMMGAGITAALLVFLFLWPSAHTIARMAEAAEPPPELARLEKRQAIVGGAAGVLGFIALMGATMF